MRAVLLLSLFQAALGASEDACIDNWLRTKPELALRFDRNALGLLCNRTAMWLQKASEPQTQSNDDIITRNQKLYLQNLRTCAGRDCLRDAVNSRCQGRRCLKQPNPVPVGTSGPSSIGVAKAPGVSVERSFESLEPNSVNVRALLPTSEDVPSGDSLQELVQGPVAESCQTKMFLAAACPDFLKARRIQDIIPGFPVADRRAQRKKFTGFRRKCLQIRNSLQRKGEAGFESLEECGDPAKVTLKRENTARLCGRVLTASTQGACTELQGALAAEGLSFDSWLSGLSGDDGGRAPARRTGGRRPGARAPTGRAGARRPAPLSDSLSSDSLDFDDIDNVDFRARRQEYRVMSDALRERFHAAMNRLKTEQIDGISKYDLLVIYHTPQESPGAHWGPAFLPFHRELLKQLEIALRQVDPDVSLPYWDSTLDQGLPTPKDSIIWTPDFFGNGDGEVVTGPYARWTATHELSFVPGMKRLFRGVGESDYGGQFKAEDIAFVKSRESYAELTACVDPTFELVHGLVHMFVGGFMADIGISPNDPAFFLHHNFIDSLWEEWRLGKQTLDDREVQYPSDDSSCNNFHFKESVMRPFAMKNGDGLSNDYTRTLYYHDPHPQCSVASPDCGSPRLFCSFNEAQPRCLSKVRLGGDCTGFLGTDICWESVCEADVCAPGAFDAATPSPRAPTSPPTTKPPTTTTATTTTTPEGFCSESVECGDPDQFCDVSWSTCLFKMSPGDNCAGFEGLPACRDGAACSQGLCRLPFQCDQGKPCPSGQFCDLGLVGSKCLDQLEVGEPCNGLDTNRNVCLPPAECLQDRCQLPATTTTPPSTTIPAVPTTTPTPSPQDPIADCLSDDACGPTHFCDAEYKTCTARLGIGEGCEGLAAYPRACVDGAACQDNVCRPQDLPAFCELDSDCAPGEFCNILQSACTPQPTPVDATCASSTECPAGEFCDVEYETCTPRVAAGEPCEGFEAYPDACLTGLCLDTICQEEDALTTTTPTTGCTTSEDCAEDSFCDTEYAECLIKNPAGADCEGFEVFPDSCVPGHKCKEGKCKSTDALKETTDRVCLSSADCAADSFCDTEFQECVRKIDNGLPCSDWIGIPDACVAGSTCQDDICTATTPEPSVDECNEVKTCPAGLFCDLEFRQCSDQIDIGDSCAGLELQPNVCVANGQCENGICVADGTTTTAETVTDPTTTLLPYCLLNQDCPADMFCDVEFESCHPRLLESEVCNGLEDNPAACADGLLCVDGVCEKPVTQPPADTCMDDSQCDEGFYCHPDGACLPLVPLGVRCPSAAPSPCVLGAVCTRGVCTLITTTAPLTTTTLPETTTTTQIPSCVDVGCNEGEFCDPEYGECVPEFGVGDICAGFETVGVNIICRGEATCIEGVCATMRTTTTTTTKRPRTTTTSTTTRAPTTTSATTRAPTTTTLRPAVLTSQPVRPDETETGAGGEEETAPFPVVYFTVSVIRGNVNFYKQPVPGASVKTTGQNTPTGYTQSLPGTSTLSSSYPYYTGATVVRVMDPAKAGYFPLVTAKVDVRDEMGRACAQMCYQASRRQYVACSSPVRLSTNSYYSDPIEFRGSSEEALEALWTKDGYYRKRLPDYLLFQC